MVQDSLGYMWIGTHRGLNRFDGYSIDSYRHPEGNPLSLYYNRIYSMGIVSGRLWMATDKGLSNFDIRNKRFTSFVSKDHGSKEFFSQVKMIRPAAQKGYLWMVSANQIRFVKVGPIDKTDRPEITSLRIGSSNGFVSAEQNPRVAENGKGIAWFSGNSYMSVYQADATGKYHLINRIEGGIGTGVRDMRYMGGFLFAMYANRVVKFKVGGRGGLAQVAVHPFQVQTDLVAMTMDNKSIWVATSEQLTRLDWNLVETSTYRHYAIDSKSVVNDINSLYSDRNSNLWVSGWMAGVCYASTTPTFFHLLNFGQSLTDNLLYADFVSALHYGNDGYVYLARKFGGIVRMNVQTHQTDFNYCIRPELLKSITSIQSDRTHLFASVRDNVMVLDKTTGQITATLTTQNGGYIFWLATDRFGRLWAATYAGLECFREEGGQWVNDKLLTAHSPAPFRLSTDLLHNIYSDLEANELIVTSANGLNRVFFDSKGRVTNIAIYKANASDHSLSNNFLWPIDKGGEHTYWVGTLGSGLNKVTFVDKSDGTYTYTAEHYGINEGASSDDIESIETDRFGRVWCGGYNLCYFDDQVHRFNRFTTDDGLQGYTFGTSSSAKDSLGNLYFGGSQGMNFFMPQSEVTTDTSSEIHFTHAIVGGKIVDGDIEYSHRIELSYPNNNLTVDFTTLNYERPHQARFRYKIRGYDDWHYIDAGQKPTASYQKLPYGHLELLVEAGDWQQWSGKIYRLDIYSQPPFWRSWIAYLFYALLLAELIYMGIRYFVKWTKMKNFFVMRKEKEKHNERIMQMKTRFFMDMSHEFRTPLTLIRHAATELSENEETESNRYVGIISRNAQKMSNMIDDLLDFHRADMKSIHLHAILTDVPMFVRSIYDEFTTWAESASLTMNLNLPEDDFKAWLDQEMVSKILGNILSNSIRYTPKGGSIDIQVSMGEYENALPEHKDFYAFRADMEQGNQLIIRVSDTGVGIARKDLPTIFDRLYRVSNNNQHHEGTGIGLSLVRSLLSLHHGGIVVSSSLGLGTEMMVFLPLSASYLKEEEKSTDNSFVAKEYLSGYAAEFEETQFNEATPENIEGRPTLLLVDDNHEVLMILYEYFKKEFNLLMAIDGQEALEKSKQYLPDLIISDVMMPKMNGFELCQALKQTLHTCHIPIILLTAISDEEKQIEGLEMGADVYMPKPYNPRLLRANVLNLLKKSKESHTEKTSGLHLREQIQNEKQREMFDEFNRIVDENLNNDDFSIDQIILQLGTNRTKLYAFIKSATGMSMGKYIMKLRLDKAAYLLRTTDLSVSEVGYSVGVESQSYFSRSFKEQFGCTPSEYIKKN